jgi:hypothetical protein
VTGNTLTWEGLANGTAYQVRVQAVNKAPEPSEFSTYSATEIPARAPDAPGAPSTARVDSVGAQTQMNVSWNAPAANGDAISAYTLTTLRGGGVVSSIEVPGGTTSQSVSVPTSETDYTFQVKARNKAGYGADSAPSSPRRAFNPPGTPTGVSATPGDNTMNIAFTPGALNGATGGEVRYEYSLNGNGSWGAIPAGGGTVSAPNNGTYTAQVRAITSADGSTYTSDPSAPSNAVAPYGAYGAPTARASGGDRAVSFSWTAPARNGRDYILQINVAGGGWQDQGMSGGNTSAPAGYSQDRTIQVRMLDANRAEIPGTATSATGTSDPEPIDTKVSVSRGTPESSSTCSDASCSNVRVTISSGVPGATYSGTVYASGNVFDDISITVDGNGNGSAQTGKHWGYPGTSVRAVVNGPDGRFEGSTSW